jgi:DNA polymerase
MPVVKDKDGARLLNKFSKPRNPTKGDARLRIRPEDDPEDAARLYAYCETDVQAEAAITAECPALEGEELEFYLCDAEMNARGVQIDVEAMEDCIAVVKATLAKYDGELRTLTGGIGVNELESLKDWLRSQGVPCDSLDEEHLTALLALPLPPAPRRTLEIRQAAGSSSVKKLFSMRNQLSSQGRLHDLFSYHGARTGRVVGRGPQPTNLPTSGPSVRQCGACANWHKDLVGVCSWCGVPTPPGKEPDEWGADAAECALRVVACRSVELVEYYFGHALNTVAGCLRALFIAAPGHELIGSDYNSIEAVVAACVAGEQWRIDLFRSGGKVYEMAASKITGIPLDEMLEYRVRTKKHHPTRKMGKVAELACFSPDTKVLTERGLLRIVDVLKSDRLWDGIAWITHEGVVEKGVREVIALDGVRMTSTHPISTGLSWKEARELASSPCTLALALGIGSQNLPSSVLKQVRREESKRYGRDATAEAQHIKSKYQISDLENQLSARRALDFYARLLSSTTGTLKHLKNTATYFPTQSIVAGFRRRSLVATARATGRTRTMEAAGLPYATSGEKTGGYSSDTQSQLTVGTTRTWRWIEQMWIKATSREMFGSSVEKKTCSTNEAFKTCNDESPNLSIVYDIVGAGPLQRFTIKTDSGWLLVHNSPYGGWTGSWKAFGADEFMSDEEIETAIKAWRATSPAIVHMWGKQYDYNGNPVMTGLEGAAVSAVLQPGTMFPVARLDGTPSGIAYQMRGDALYCRLPSGRELTYHRPRLAPQERYGRTSWQLSFEGYNTNPLNGPRGWIRIITHGGRLFENVCQAVARDVLRRAIVTLEQRNYPLVMQVYDEVVCEVLAGCGSLEEIERIMGDLPEWCRDWPIRATGGWRGKRFRK